MKPNTNLHFIDNARGLAALAVAIFHYFGSIGNNFLDNTIVEQGAVLGEHGVFVFFIVSGFIMPYTLYTKGYKISSYPKFLWKRIIRLDPPYIISIVFIVLLMSFLSVFTAQKTDYSISQVLLHLGYLNGIFDKPWVNVVYWTLAIEFQYYVLLGLIFPLLMLNNYTRFVAIALLLVLPSLIPFSRIYVFSYTHYFAFGMICCFYYLKLMEKFQLLALGILIFGLVFSQNISIVSIVVMSLTLTLFWGLNRYNKYLHFLGLISYSLYLIHNYTGLFLILYIKNRTENIFLEFWAGILAIFIAIGCAYLFYLFIEKPSKRWASEVKY